MLLVQEDKQQLPDDLPWKRYEEQCIDLWLRHQPKLLWSIIVERSPCYSIEMRYEEQFDPPKIQEKVKVIRIVHLYIVIVHLNQ